MRERLPLPRAMQEAPEVPLGLEIYYQAFWELSSCRPVGWGPLPIPWTTMMDYARACGLDEEQTDDLLYYTRAMDQAYLGWHGKKGK